MSRLFLLVIALSLFLSFFRLGSVTLFDVDEAVFATATKEMVQSGDWITPTYNGRNRYDKPILFYWLMAVPYRVLGISEFSSRFPSALASSVLVLSVFLFVRRFRDEETALAASLSFTLSLYFLVYSHAAVTDMVLTLFITLSLISFYLSVTEEKGRDRYLSGFYLFSGLAFLTKGLIGILFPFAISMIYLLATEGTKGIGKVFSVKGVILFLVVSAPWYIAQYSVNGDDFIQQFFIKHHFKRYTGVISGHRGPFYYYIPVLIIGFFPWVAFLPAGIKNALQDLRRLKTEGEGSSPIRRHSLLVFALLWAAFVMVFFSLATTKLPNYILPSIPAVAILVSSGLSSAGVLAETRMRYHAGIFIVVTSLLLAVGLLVSRTYLTEIGIHGLDWTFSAALILFALAVTSFYAFVSRKTSYYSVAAIVVCFLLSLSFGAIPVASNYVQGTLYRYSLQAKQRLQDGGRLIAYGMNNPSIVFYSGHKVIGAGSRDEVVPLVEENVNVVAISRMKDVEMLKELGFQVLEEDGRYALLERRVHLSGKI
ncbi:MAG TPA: glycosyltransferase family 39 protein [Thermodesulfovibrionales bacterium]|nr:glycosyltransferase family 39 protein [Thermodesulfovibrionales bacterium]